MKKKYYKINAFYYFSLLIYFKDNTNEMIYNEINQNALKIKEKYKFNYLSLPLLNDDYLNKMIKCCGNLIFNKKDSFYFAKPNELFPIVLYFHFLFQKNYYQKELVQNISVSMNKQLTEFEHLDFKDQFDKTLNVNCFINNEKKIFKSLIQFLNHYYKPHKKVVIKKRRIYV